MESTRLDAITAATIDGAVHLGRKAILDREDVVLAYDLLHPDPGAPSAGRGLLRFVEEVGLPLFTGGKPGVLRLPVSVLDEQSLAGIPLDRLILEPVCDEEPTGAQVELLRSIAAGPTRVLLPDPVADPRYAPLVDLADVLKVDIARLEPDRIPARVQTLRAHGAPLLADNVHDHNRHDHCLRAGFELFSGMYLATPRDRAGGAVELQGDRLSLLELLTRIDDPDVAIADLEEIAARNVALSYQLLRYVNSAFVGLRTEVDSLRRAIVLLGPPTVRQLASVLLSRAAQDKPLELTRTSLVRARMCDAVAAAVGDARPAYYLAGLFSTLDALLDASMEQVVGALALTEEIRDALLYHDGRVGRVLAAAKLYERADFDDPIIASFDPDVLSEAYLRALSFADESVSVIGSLDD